MDNRITEWGDGTYVVHPQEARVERGALVLFKELQIRGVDVAGGERFSHPEHDIDVTWPFPDDAGYEACAELRCLALLHELGVLHACDGREDDRREVGRQGPPAKANAEEVRDRREDEGGQGDEAGDVAGDAEARVAGGHGWMGEKACPS